MQKSLCSLLLASILLVSCGEDAGGQKRRKGTAGETVTPGIEGSGTGAPAHIHRLRSAAVLTSTDLITYLTGSNTKLPDVYRTIPVQALDDEGSSANIISVDRLGRPTAVCGQGADLTLTERKANCKSVMNKSKNTYRWSASSYGAAGEADWVLVSVDENNHEIWQDTRTGLVWSDIVSTGNNWCLAAGSSVDACKDRNANGSELCAAIYKKLPNIKWRLPTRNDYLQADIDGLRFVLRSDEESFWTATLDSSVIARDRAWAYHSKQGTLSASSFGTELAVRCIGASPL